MERTIKGFDEIQIFDLYSFVCRYEEIKRYKKAIDFQKAYPDTYNGLKFELDKLKLHHPKHKSWNPKDLQRKEIEENHFYYINHGGKLQSILYHIRNAIAHGHIVLNTNGYVRIKDFDNSGKKQTANALIQIDMLKNVIKYVNANIKL